MDLNFLLVLLFLSFSLEFPFLHLNCPESLIVLLILVLLVSVTFMMKDILVIIDVNVFRNSSLLSGNIVNESFLLFSLLDKLGLEQPASVHDVFFNFSQDSVDPFSVILPCVLLLNLSHLFEPVVLFQTHIKLVGLKSSHPCVIFAVSIFLRFYILHEVFISE